MSLREFRRCAGRLAMVGFAGHSAPDDLRRLVRAFDLGGVVYFARNVVDPAQVAELSREVSSLSRDWPLWIGVDQEGGRVARMRRPFTEWPPMLTLGRAADEALADRFASALADELAAVGVTLDFAPVLDVLTNSKNTVIGDRALSDQAGVVARLAPILIRALETRGVAACGKHFPGHGDTTADSHEELPVVEHGPDRLEAVELVPFRAAVAAGVASLMVAHVLVPALDEERPASLSPTIVTEWIKAKLAFGGVVFTDDLGMKGVSASRSLGDSAVAAVAAGCDVVLLCNSTADEQAAAIEALIHAAEAGTLTETRLDDALARQRLMKERFAAPRPGRRPRLDCVGSERHQHIAAEMAAWR